jgi:hypothetical protein
MLEELLRLKGAFEDKAGNGNGPSIEMPRFLVASLQDFLSLTGAPHDNSRTSRTFASARRNSRQARAP